MAKDATVSERLKKIDEALDQEEKRWVKENLPSPKSLYRMNDDELMHHCHILAITKLLKDKLGVTDAEIELAIKEKFLEELQALFPLAQGAKQASIRANLLQGVRPQI